MVTACDAEASNLSSQSIFLAIVIARSILLGERPAPRQPFESKHTFRMLFQNRHHPDAALSLLLTCGFLGARLCCSSASHDGDWPQWRGPLLTGQAPSADPPISWSETENVKWKVMVPGFGTSTPVVWGDQVFILTAVATGKGTAPESPSDSGPRASKELHQFVVTAYARKTGKELWRTVVNETAPHEGHHVDHGFASASPVTDGDRLWAFFGSRGLHCLDLQGKLLWSKDLGRMRTRNSFGEGSSPALHADKLVICWDDETDNDFVAAFDKTTGSELWRKPRDEATGWSTPLIVVYQGKAQVVINATKRVRSYDLADGTQLWEAGGKTSKTIPTPVASVDTVYVTSGFRGSTLQAIALGRSGDLTGTDAIRWSLDQNTPYVPSPLLSGRFLFFVAANKAEISCVHAKTGAIQFGGQRLEGMTGIYASPVSAKDRVYILGRNGLCYVLRLGPNLEVISRNKIDDRTDASPALAGTEIFLRGHKALYCISH